MTQILVEKNFLESIEDVLLDAEIFVNTCSVEKRMLIQALFVELKRLINKDPEPEFVTTPSDMRVVGQQQRVTMESGEFIVEWNGTEWFKKYLICQVTKYNATGCWQEKIKTPVDTGAHSLEEAHRNVIEKRADFDKWLDEHPEAEKQTPIGLITPEELMEIVKEGQKIYGDKGILFSSTKTVQEVIEDLERLSSDAKRISERPEGTDQKYYCGISDGIKWSIRRVKNIEQAVKTEVSGDNVTPTAIETEYGKAYKITEGVNRQAIIEILDMLTKIHYIIDYKEMREQASKLKTKLGGLS